MGETLYLYLAVNDHSIASVLIREVEGKQLPIYYVSKVLNRPETRYTNIEKLAYSLVVTTRKLRIYFESHHIIVYTNAPLKQIYHKLDQSRRMLKWSIELCGYDINFAPRTLLKGQALANFLVENSFSENENLALIPYKKPTSIQSNAWFMTVDGSANVKGIGIGITLESPSKTYRECRSIRLEFSVSNNQAEYEALLIGIS